MKANASQLRAALDKINPATRFYLFHGPDAAGAAEHAEKLFRGLGPDTERIDVDMRALREQPGRLADEAASLSLFGTRRLVRVRAIEEGALEAVSLLLAAERIDNPVVAIGPGLKTSGKLVKAAIAAPAALSHGCYVPEGLDAVRLATGIAREQGLRLAGDVAQRLAHAAGGDRAILTREIEKLALFLDAAPDRPREADGAALDSVGAALEEADWSEAIAAVVDGRVADVGDAIARLGGASGVPLMRQLTRRLQTLAELRVDLDREGEIDRVLEKHRIYPRERQATGRALRRWSATQIARAVDRARMAERALMHANSAGEVLAEAEATAIARAAARGRA